jgi:hypothetical protein
VERLLLPNHKTPLFPNRIVAVVAAVDDCLQREWR